MQRSPRNVSGQMLDELGTAIVGGRYAVGAVIPPEPQLCEELQVSRTVVREAVKSLAAKGMLVTGPKVGDIFCHLRDRSSTGISQSGCHR